MRRTFLRCIIFCTFLFSVISNLSALTEVRHPAKENEDWRVLKQAEDAFTEGNYGAAIDLAEKAKASRKQECGWKIYTLEYSFQNSKIRKAGDSIGDVLAVLKERDAKDAIIIIQAELDKHGKDFFNNSISKLKEFVSKETTYPEADYLIGKIYRLEGEQELAIKYLNDAYAASAALDVPEQKYDILYDLADISFDSDKKDEYEKYLLSIVRDDTYFVEYEKSINNDPQYKDKNSFVKAMLRSISVAEERKKDDEQNSVMNKFFKLYRCSYFHLIPAYQKLTKYYEENNQMEKALVCSALGSLNAFTKIFNVISERKVNYTYTTVNQVLIDSAKYSDIVSWGDKNGAWELFYLFAKESASCQSALFAQELYTALSLTEPIEYWRMQAERALVKPDTPVLEAEQTNK